MIFNDLVKQAAVCEPDFLLAGHEPDFLFHNTKNLIGENGSFVLRFVRSYD